ncbi:hypothetical protein UFOVP703_21 [uncultured Caudovirales phage]|uniref:DUF7007 domain-containing protein n=1 Tax=uncultured Caudovirales phage TaxID=2100421 RepID=A0A6J5NFU1_9CAUD|nr:hypothetical protein UFOVP703_21 [uncultured Caudovirales phage]
MHNDLTSTPWGTAELVEVVAPGIRRVHTARHGGYHLAPERIAQMPEALRCIPTFQPHPWFEEDCDWILVVLSFPDLFDDAHVAGAVEGCGWHPSARDWLGTVEAAPIVARAGAWKARSASLYRITCEGSIPARYQARAGDLERALRQEHGQGPLASLWWAALRRISDGAEAEVLATTVELRAQPFDLATLPAERVMRRPA